MGKDLLMVTIRAVLSLITLFLVTKMIGKKQVTKIGSCCFYVSPFNESNRKNITVIDIPEGVSGIGDRAFVGCKALLEIHIPKTMSVIGEYAFWECSSVSIHAPSGSRVCTQPMCVTASAGAVMGLTSSSVPK